MDCVKTLPLLLVFPVMAGAEGCYGMNYVPHKDNAVFDHVLAYFNVTWEWGCVMKCQQDTRCRSMNYGQRSAKGSPYHTCEINSVTRYYQRGTFYRHREGFTYLENENIRSSLKIGSFEMPASSCKEIFTQKSGGRSGVYFIRSGSSVNEVYCDFEESKCGDRGWALIMKMDGTKTTFSHSSAYWTNTEPYNAGSIGGGLSTEEIKLSTYHTLPFTKLCLGMKVGQTTRWQLLRYTANSLFAAIADGHFRSTNLSRSTWKALIKDSSLQRFCNREGFNAVKNKASYPGEWARVRLGIVGNENGEDCDSPDSWLGFGGYGNIEGCAMNDRNSVGNVSGNCQPDNGEKDIRAFGYILAQ